MSNAVFPVLPGLMWNLAKVPMFNTRVQRSVSLNELRASFAEDPLYTFKLRYEFLRDDVTNEIRTLGGFFIARRGSWDSFLYTDPGDNSVTAQSFGTGDGATTAFQLVRDFGNGRERVSNLNAAPSIYLNAVLQTSGYTVSATGLVTFAAAPGAGVALAWTGTYYFRCRFAKDEQEYAQFMQQFWEARSVDLLASLGTKI